MSPSFPGRSRPAHAVGTFLAAAVRAWRVHKADRAMAHLSDEMLHDIGVSRGEIAEVVRHGRAPH